MTENKSEMRSGCIIIDDYGTVLYSSGNYEYETDAFLKEIRVFDRIRTGNFGMEMCGRLKVSVERILMKGQTIYTVEFMDAAHTDNLYDETLQIIKEKCDELEELKETIEATRAKLNDLVSEKQNHLSEDILNLSRELDYMISRYLTLEMDLES